MATLETRRPGRKVTEEAWRLVVLKSIAAVLDWGWKNLSCCVPVPKFQFLSLQGKAGTKALAGGGTDTAWGCVPQCCSRAPGAALLHKICCFCPKTKQDKILQDLLTVLLHGVGVFCRCQQCPVSRGCQRATFVRGWHSGPAKHRSSPGNSRKPLFAGYL